MVALFAIWSVAAHCWAGLRNWQYKESSVELRAGDLLVLFTDGIKEAMSPDGTEFGEDRLITAVTDAASQTLADLQPQVLAT